MNHLLPRPRCGAALLLAAATAAGCATTKPTPSPQEEYRQAVAQAQKGHYVEAQRLFEEVRDADTPVRLELLAEVGVADALYKGGKFEEAAQAYNKLLAVHSGDPIADYLNYQLGMCFYRRIDTVDRDQGLTRKARSQFMALITRYPESDLVPAAREKLQACNDYLARRELYVGRFYLERGNYEAAKRRFVRGLVRYGKVEAAPELLHDLCLCTDGLGETKAADQAAERLRKEFPTAAATVNLTADREEARARRESGSSNGPLHRLGQWWNGRHKGEEGKAEDSSAAVAAPAEPPAASTPPLPDEPAPAPTPAIPTAPTTTGDGGAAAEPLHHSLGVSALAPEAPWPGSTVATVSAGAATTPSAVVPPPEEPSRWRHLLFWLHRNGGQPIEAKVDREATPATTPAPGLIIRHIPPVGSVGEKARETATATPAAASAAVATVTTIPTVPAETAPSPPATAPVVTQATPQPSPAPMAPPAEPSVEPSPATPPVTVSAPPTAAVGTAPLTRALTAQQNSGDLVVEEFPAVDDGDAKPPVAAPRVSLADRVEATLGQEEMARPAATPPATHPVATTRLPAAAEPTPQPLVASGDALRHDVPRPMPQPPFTRPTPPLGDDALPATLTDGDETVAWRTMTPPPTLQVEEGSSAPTAVSSVEVSQPPSTGESEGHGAFWGGVRERFTGTTAAAE